MSRNIWKFKKLSSKNQILSFPQSNEINKDNFTTNVTLFNNQKKKFFNHQIALKKIISPKESTSNSPQNKPKTKYSSLTKSLLFPKKLLNSQSMQLLNTKYNQFALMRNNKTPYNNHTNKLNSNSNTGNNTNNYIINTLNVSTKNLINNSLEYSDVNEYEIKIKQLQKENSDMITIAKDKEILIKELENKNKDLENELNKFKIKYKIIQKKYNEIKESEEQLLSILYIIDQSGNGIDKIMAGYNNDKAAALNEVLESNRSLESAQYVPITLEHSIQPVPMSNVPKLNFDKINQIRVDKQLQVEEYCDECSNNNIKHIAKYNSINKNTLINIDNQNLLIKKISKIMPKTKIIPKSNF